MYHTDTCDQLRSLLGARSTEGYLKARGQLYILTYSMEQSPWEANQSLQLVKKFPAFLWNPKVLYRTNKCTPPVTILNRLYPVPTTRSSFLKINLNIILPSTSGSPQWHISLRFPDQHPVHTSLLRHCEKYMLCKNVHRQKLFVSCGTCKSAERPIQSIQNERSSFRFGPAETPCVFVASPRR
jgi:hypothetical protein